MPKMRVCCVPGCPILHTNGGRCPTHKAEHQAEYDQARGTPTERGYGREHRKLRTQLAPHVAAGRAICSRCHQPIAPGEPWALDHNDDRTGYLGPSHQHCNNAAAGRAAHR